MRGLTDRQREVLEVIDASLASRGIPPTIREVCSVLGIPWTAKGAVWEHFVRLEKKGAIRLTRNERGGVIHRGIVRVRQAVTPGFRFIPRRQCADCGAARFGEKCPVCP